MMINFPISDNLQDARVYTVFRLCFVANFFDSLLIIIQMYIMRVCWRHAIILALVRV